MLPADQDLPNGERRAIGRPRDRRRRPGPSPRAVRPEGASAAAPKPLSRLDRPPPPRPARLSFPRLAIGLVGAGVLAGMFLWLQRLLGDALFAGVLTLVVPVIVASWMGQIGHGRRR